MSLLAAIASKTITYERNEALFCFALYQVSQFIFNLDINENLRERVLTLVLSAEKLLQDHILLFRKFSGRNIVFWKTDDFDQGKLRWINSVRAKMKH